VHLPLLAVGVVDNAENVFPTLCPIRHAECRARRRCGEANRPKSGRRRGGQPPKRKGRAMVDFSEDFAELDDSALLSMRAEMRAELERLPPAHPNTPRSWRSMTRRPRMSTTAPVGPGRGRARSVSDVRTRDRRSEQSATCRQRLHRWWRSKSSSPTPRRSATTHSNPGLYILREKLRAAEYPAAL